LSLGRLLQRYIYIGIFRILEVSVGPGDLSDGLGSPTEPRAFEPCHRFQRKKAVDSIFCVLLIHKKIKIFK
jgi:hypothetical protein